MTASGGRSGSVSSLGAERRVDSLGRLYLRLLLVAGTMIVLDQGTKSLALAAFETPREIIPGVLTFRILLNPGGAFGILQGFPEFFLVASILAAAAILFWVRHIDRPAWTVPLGMVLGGGLGNLIDRLARDTQGRVVDFIDLHVWPVFNLADAGIVIGIAVIVILGGREGRRAEGRDADVRGDDDP